MKMKQKKVYLTVGIPGVGKTSFIRKQVEKNGGIHVSRDEVRFSMLKDGDEYFGIENQVFEAFVKKVQEAIDNEEGPADVYVDATHISWGSRKKILSRLNFSNVKETIMLFFDVSAETALARNATRTGRSLVPESAMLSMARNITKPIPSKYTRVWTINEDGEVISIE